MTYQKLFSPSEWPDPDEVADALDSANAALAAKEAEIAGLRAAVGRTLTLYEHEYLMASVDGAGRVTHTMNMLRAALQSSPIGTPATNMQSATGSRNEQK